MLMDNHFLYPSALCSLSTLFRRAYSPDQIKAMRLAMAKYWSAFIWISDAGGAAYNYTIASLRKRVHNHVAEYWRRKKGFL